MSSSARGSGPSSGSRGAEEDTLSFDEALEKIETRFIYNLPETELSHIERLFFQIEQAHWFYEDFLVEKYSNLPSYKFKTFTEKLFNHCQLLQPLQDQCSMLCDDFNTYRYQIPVCGCILLNSDMTKVVLVRNWKGTSWSFPKGKINEDETSYHCAIRETFEETGFNPMEYCQEEHYLVVYEEKKVTRLYIAVGVPENTIFNTQTRKEISRVEFHPLDQLPKKAWGVHPFLEKLQRWIRKHQKLLSQGKGFKRKTTTGTPSRFDERNEDTFGTEAAAGGAGGGAEAGWSVQDMFAVNARLTGQTYSYDGNPHNFGDKHPQYVKYSPSPHTQDQPPPLLLAPSSSYASSPSSRTLFPQSQYHPPLPRHPHDQPSSSSTGTTGTSSQDMKLISKTQSLFSQMPSGSASSSEAMGGALAGKRRVAYFPSPFVFETQRIVQRLDQALGIPSGSSSSHGGRRGKRAEN